MMTYLICVGSSPSFLSPSVINSFALQSAPESIRMIPSDVVTAQVESCVLPTQYRLSNIFAEGVYHSERGGTLRSSAVFCAGGAAGATGPLSDRAGAQTDSYRSMRSFPGSYASALAAAICGAAAALEP